MENSGSGGLLESNTDRAVRAYRHAGVAERYTTVIRWIDCQ
jgi:hypothetical protein